MISISAVLPGNIVYDEPATISATITSDDTVLQAELRLNGTTVETVDTVIVGPYVFSPVFGPGYFHVEIYAINVLDEEAVLDLGYATVIGPDTAMQVSSLKLYDFSLGIRGRIDGTFSVN